MLQSDVEELDPNGQYALAFVARRASNPARAARLQAMRERLGAALEQQMVQRLRSGLSSKTLNITHATLMDAYCLALTFDDGKTQTVDFKPFLTASHHPSVRAYLDLVRFAQFELRYGELVWGNYDLCFPIMDLYNNTLLHKGEHLAAA